MTDAAAPRRKLADITAERIETEILDSGARVGDLVGLEPELIKRYDVSRGVFREAVRLLEHRGVARMRRGTGGGLVVTKPAADIVVNAMATYLQFDEVSLEQLEEARVALELHVVGTAADRIDADGRAVLWDYLRREAESSHSDHAAMHEFHSVVARLAGNPALALFVDSLTALTRRQRMQQLPVASHAAVHSAHMRIAEAIIAGDADAARRRMAGHLGALSEYWAAQPGRAESRGQPRTRG